jgi:hypothetical protein
MAEDPVLARVTSQEWCDRMAKTLQTGKALKGIYRLRVRSGGKTLLLRVLSNQSPRASAQNYLDRDKDVPAYIVRAILEPKGGRHFRLEQWADDVASAISCYLAMERLRTIDPHLSQTAAGERVGKLRGKSCAAVVRCWKKFRDTA